MSEHEERLSRYQFQMGPARGRLAAALDILTDAITLAGQHGIYCRHPSASGKPAADLTLIMSQIQESKGLIIETMEELKKPPGPGPDR